MYSVLYVDDETALLEISKMYMEKDPHFHVDTAESARDGLKLLSSRTYDAVVSDYQMPDMDGIEFLKQVRKKSTIPFILFTGKGREEVVIDAINNGADFYLQKGGAPKPQFAELQSKIQQATRRKKAEDKIIEDESRLRSLFEHMIEGLALHELVVDEQGTATEYRIISANAAFEKQLGLKREDAIGKLSRDAYRVDEPPYLDIYSRVTQSGTAEIFETYFQPLGKYFLISVYSPQTGQFATLFQDITRIRKAEAELKEREKSFRTIAENLPDIVVRFDRSLRTVFINESVELVTGLPRDSYIGKTLSEAGMPPELVEYWDDQLNAVFEYGKPTSFSFSHPCPAGVCQFESRIIPEFSEDERVRTLLVLVRDITNQPLAIPSQDSHGNISGKS